jgi:radical SAM protein with 4Fe4S-binding SPASM domain
MNKSKPEIPVLSFEITHRCSHTCKYCYNSGIPLFLQDEMPLKVLKRLFRFASIRNIAITGGEPLLSEYLREFIVEARLGGAQVHLLTNGSSRDRKLWRWLSDAGIKQFQIPVNSHLPHVHDNLTQIPGSWRGTMANISYLLESGGKVLPVVVLTRDNFQDIEKTLQFLNAMNMDKVMINRYNLSRGNYYQYLSLSKPELENTFRKINDFARTNNLFVSSNVCTPHCLIDPSNYPDIVFGGCSPDPLKRPLTVDHQGNVRLCNHSPVVAGNIFSQTITDILACDYTTRWAENVPDYCTSCKKYTLCMGGCRAASEQIMGSNESEDPLISQINNKS